jgi:hypothetical protein
MNSSGGSVRHKESFSMVLDRREKYDYLSDNEEGFIPPDRA